MSSMLFWQMSNVQIVNNKLIIIYINKIIMS